MIEFKSACGHTVRARDEDAGRDVKCSYCGKDVRVPSTKVDDLDFLLREASDAPAQPPPKRSKRGGPFFARRTRGDGNPLDTVLKLTYAAAAVTVIVVVTRSYILPALMPEKPEHQPFGDAGAAQAHAPPEVNRYGLMTLEGPGGLHISALPAGAEIYVAEIQKCSVGKRLIHAEGSRRVAGGGAVTGMKGMLKVEVALAWNDKSLRDYPEYNAFRRRLENAVKEEDKSALMRGYFLPDGADSVFVATTSDQIFLVRQYTANVQPEAWDSVHAMFIPASTGIEEMVGRFLPAEGQYRFDEEYVRGELEYYNVPARDRTFVLTALSRMGAIPFVTQEPDGGARKVRLFKIDAATGQFRTQILGDAPVAGVGSSKQAGG